MARLDNLISWLQAIQEGFGDDVLCVSAKEDALVVRLREGNRTICFIRAAEGDQPVRIEWKGNWQQRFQIDTTSALARERDPRSEGAGPELGAALCCGVSRLHQTGTLTANTPSTSSGS
jgi:hypothetical protein